MTGGASDPTPWAIAFRYPADDPMIVQPLPEEDEILRRLGEVERFIEAVARSVERVSPAGGLSP